MRTIKFKSCPGSILNWRLYFFYVGSLHCVACTDQGEVYTWGDNDEGQLGDGTTNAIQRPRFVGALQVSNILRFNALAKYNNTFERQYNKGLISWTY